MTPTLRSFLLLVAAVVIGNGVPAIAAEAAVTTITISDMDCAGCAKKVTTKLMEVPGVAKVETEHETGIAKVTFKPKAVVSPKALWEAVEKAKKTPTKLQGPGGTFTAKPKD